MEGVCRNFCHPRRGCLGSGFCLSSPSDRRAPSARFCQLATSVARVPLGQGSTMCRDRSECKHALALLALGCGGSQAACDERPSNIRTEDRTCPLAKKSRHVGTARHQGEGAYSVDTMVKVCGGSGGCMMHSQPVLVCSTRSVKGGFRVHPLSLLLGSCVGPCPSATTTLRNALSGFEGAVSLPSCNASSRLLAT